MSRKGSQAIGRPGRPAPVSYSRKWMEGWVNAAAKTQSVEGANTEVGISMTEYHRGRMEDLAFDTAALALDQVLDLLVLSSVRNTAIKGDAKAQVLYYGKARLPAFVPGFASWRAAKADDGEAQAIRPEVAEAMVAAGVKAADEAARVDGPAPRRRRRGSPPAPG